MYVCRSMQAHIHIQTFLMYIHCFMYVYMYVYEHVDAVGFTTFQDFLDFVIFEASMKFYPQKLVKGRGMEKFILSLLCKYLAWVPNGWYKDP